MKKKMSHTAFVEIVNSKPTEGLALILQGHKHLTSGDFRDKIWSVRLKNIAVGTKLVVTITVSGTRRFVIAVNLDSGIESVEQFLEIYKDTLDVQAKIYDKNFGSDFPATVKVKVKFDAAEEAHEELVKETCEPDPDWSTQIYIPEADNVLFETIRKLSNTRHVAVMMIGPSGYGKTSIPEQKAKDWEMEFLRWDCATVRDPEEFFGFRGAVDGSTMTADGAAFFSTSQFTKVVEKGNCVVVLDELNRIDPYISNILFPLLDHAGKTSVAGHEIVVGPNTIFVATVNLGYQFTGTFTLDTALTNRFSAKVLVEALPEPIEKAILIARGELSASDALAIVRIMKKLRRLNEDGRLSIDASTRVSIQLAELVGCGMDIKQALVYVVVNGVSKEEAKTIVDTVGFTL